MEPVAPAVTTSLVRLTAISVTNSVICENTFDYYNGSTTPASAADLDELIANWLTANQTLFLACLSPLSELTQMTAQELHFGVTPTRVFSLTGAVGTAGATNLPLEMTAILSRYTPLKGKHGRGRLQMAAVPNTFFTPATNANVINATGLTAYNALGTSLLASVITTSNVYVHCVSTRPTPPSTLVNNASLITSYVTRTVMGTQRRRRPGRGI